MDLIKEYNELRELIVEQRRVCMKKMVEINGNGDYLDNNTMDFIGTLTDHSKSLATRIALIDYEIEGLQRELEMESRVF